MRKFYPGNAITPAKEKQFISAKFEPFKILSYLTTLKVQNF